MLHNITVILEEIAFGVWCLVMVVSVLGASLDPMQTVCTFMAIIAALMAVNAMVSMMKTARKGYLNGKHSSTDGQDGQGQDGPDS